MMRRRTHLNEADLRSLGPGGGAAPAVRQHLEGCERCRAEAEVVRHLRRRRPLAACPEAEDLVRLADRLVSPAERVALERHLTDCVACARAAELLALVASRLGSRRAPSPQAPDSAVLAGLRARLRALVAFAMPEALALVTRGAAGEDASPAYRRAMRQYRAGRYPEALASFLAARHRGSGPDLAFYLGLCLLHQGRAPEAMEALAEAAALSRRDGGYHWYLAQAALAAGEAGEAEAHLRRAARLPGSHRAEAGRLAQVVADLVAGRRRRS